MNLLTDATSRTNKLAPHVAGAIRPRGILSWVVGLSLAFVLPTAGCNSSGGASASGGVSGRAGAGGTASGGVDATGGGAGGLGGNAGPGGTSTSGSGGVTGAGGGLGGHAATTGAGGTTPTGGATGSGGATGGSASPDGGAMDAAADVIPTTDASDGSVDAVVQPKTFTHLDVLAGAPGAAGSIDGVGTKARFLAPRASAFDGAGNLFVIDSGNSTIRKVVLATGQVTTLAGAAGMVGTVDGIGAAARFGAPRGITWDGAGNLYVGDSKTVIRKVVVATGQVTTLAGAAGSQMSADGTGSAATFTEVRDLTFEAGNLFVVDYDRIRKVTPAGVVTTPTLADVATTPPSQIVPVAAIGDGAGNLLVADHLSIVKVAVATGAVTWLAGVRSASDSVDGPGADARFADIRGGGLSFDGAGNLFVADGGNHTIRKVVVSSGVVSTVAGMTGAAGSSDGVGAAARFGLLMGVTADRSGNLFVADEQNSALRKLVVATGQVTTFVGLPSQAGNANGAATSALFRTPTGVAADEAGNVYVIDAGNNLIRKIAAGTGVVSTLAGGNSAGGDGVGTDAKFNFQGPGHPGLAADGAGHLFVTEINGRTVRQIVLATGGVTTLAGTASTSGNVDGVGAAARFGAPSGIASDRAGHLFVADAGQNRTVRQIDVATANVTTLAGSGMAANVDGVGTAASFSFAAPPRVGVACFGGDVFVSDGVASVRRIVVATRAVTTLAGVGGTVGTADGVGGAARFSAPIGIAADGAGNLLVADGERLQKIVIATGAVTTVLGNVGSKGVLAGPVPAALNFPLGVALMPDGTVAMTDMLENVVLRLR